MTTALEEGSLLLPPRLAHFLGRSEALLLQQLHYWLTRAPHLIDGVAWIYNSYSQWAEQVLFSVSTVRRAFLNLRELGVVKVEKREKRQYRQRYWYTIDYDRLKALQESMCSFWTHRSSQNEQMDLPILNTSSINSETTSQTTTMPVAVAEGKVIKTEEGKSDSLSNSDLDPALSTKASPLGDPSSAAPETQISNEKLAQEFSELGIEDNRTVRSEMNRWWPVRISNALAYVRQQKAKRWVLNPSGLFVTALRNGYKPEPEPQRREQKAVSRTTVSQAAQYHLNFLQTETDEMRLWKLRQLWRDEPEVAATLINQCPTWGIVLTQSGPERVQ
ncbi:MAG: helix-turn-helix domain-containing protein [Leptolyngbyaceae cyanobacterium bins.59]|nr:helix-turn-helix domain-containing protein [Leptolyngbyaceae cyanobacterium bins.59]